MRTTTMVAGLALATLLAPACKKADKAEGEPGAAKMAEAPRPKPEPRAITPNTPEQNAARYAECWGFANAKDDRAFATCFADKLSAVAVDSGMPAMQGRQPAVDHIKQMWTAFPDMKGAQLLTLVNGGKIVSIDVLTGTHAGAMAMGPNKLPATNKPIGMMTAHAVEIGKDNLAERMWIFMDQTTLLGQLGVVPMPVRAVMTAPTTAGEVVIAKDDDAEKANLEAYKKMSVAFNGHDKALHAMYAADAVLHDATTPKDLAGAKEIAAFNELIWKGFSDAKGELKDAWAAGPYTVGIVSNKATNDGDVKEWKLKKTGKPINFTSVEINKWEGGKVKEAWMVWNSMAMMQQLGMVPPMGAPAAADAPKDTAKPADGAAKDAAAKPADPPKDAAAKPAPATP